MPARASETKNAKSKLAVAHGYDALVGQLRMSDAFYAKCVDIAQPRPKSRILDVGCGQGHLLALLRAHGVHGCIGCDLSRALAAYAREVSAASIIRGDAEQMPFALESFDGAFMTEVLEHLLEPERALSSIAGVLKRGGWLLLSVPNHDWPRHARYLRASRIYQPVNDHWYRRAEIAELLASAGFTIRIMDGYGSLFGGGFLNAAIASALARLIPSTRTRRKRLIVLAERA